MFWDFACLVHIRDFGLISNSTPAPAKVIDLFVEDSDPHGVLREANKTMGLALDESEIDYLVTKFTGESGLGRSPFDVELYMFAQINSGIPASDNVDGERS